MPVAIPRPCPVQGIGLLARSTGKTGGRQRLAENRNTTLIMEHDGPERNAARYRGMRRSDLTGLISNASRGGRVGNIAPFGLKIFLNYAERGGVSPIPIPNCSPAPGG